jgi:hypothetical protein
VVNARLPQTRRLEQGHNLRSYLAWGGHQTFQFLDGYARSILARDAVSYAAGALAELWLL